MNNFKQFSIFGAEKLLSAIFSFVIVKLITSNLGQDDYGKLELYILTISVLSTLVNWGLGSSVAREIILNKKEADKVLRSAFNLIMYSSFILLFLLILFIIFDFGIPIFTAFVIVIGSILTIIVNVFLSLSRGISRAEGFAFSSIFQSITYILLIYFLDPKIIDKIIYIYVFTFVVQVFILLIIFRNIISFKQVSNNELTRSMKKYGFPLVFANLAALLFNISDRYFIGYLLDYSHLAKYTVTYKVCSVMMLFISVVQLVWPKIMYGNYDENRKEIIGYDCYFRAYSFILGLILILLTINTPYLVSLLSDSSYVLNDLVVYLVCSGMLFLGLMYINSSPFHICGNTSKITSIITVSGLINIILNFFLIPIYGVMGAAGSTLLSMSFTFVFSGVLSNGLLNSKLSYGRFGLFYLSISLFIFIPKDSVNLLSINLFSILYVSLCGLVLKPVEIFRYFKFNLITLGNIK